MKQTINVRTKNNAQNNLKHNYVAAETQFSQTTAKLG